MKQNNKRDRSTVILTVIIVILACLVLALGVFSVRLIFKTPLGEPMTLVLKPSPQAAVPTPTTFPTAIAGAQQITATVHPTLPPAEQALEQPDAKPQPVGVCGNTGSLSVLFAGADFAGGVPPRGADAVRLAKFDFDNHKITVVAFPRDLWVNTPALNKYSIEKTRLGLTYYYEKEYTPGPVKHKVTAATSVLAQTLYDNFEVEPNNYLTLELSNIADMIDTIGGVEINNPYAFVSDAHVTFPAGQLMLYGNQASEYVRTYSPGGEPARIQRQELFMRGLQDKVISADILAKLPDLIKQFDKTTYTDLSPKQMLDLACLAKEVPEDQIIFQEISGDLVRLSDNRVMIPDVDEIRDRLKVWLAQ